MLEFQDSFCIFVNSGDSCSHTASEGSPCKAINKNPKIYPKLAAHFHIQVLQFIFENTAYVRLCWRVLEKDEQHR